MYDLYGAQDLSVEQLHRLVSAALGITFRGHFSEAVGDYYFAEDGTSEFMVESNLATDEEGIYHLEADFPDYGTLFHAVTEHGDAIRDALAAVAGLTFLRRDFES
jgi:hypothetical protein